MKKQRHMELKQRSIHFKGNTACCPSKKALVVINFRNSMDTIDLLFKFSNPYKLSLGEAISIYKACL
jgi:hypothetical protein